VRAGLSAKYVRNRRVETLSREPVGTATEAVEMLTTPSRIPAR
jgi:hypothetical protein